MSIANTIRNGVRRFVADAGYWSNVMLGIGDTRDPTRNWRFASDVCELPEDELEALWNYNRIARRVCNAIVEDGLRQGFEATGEHDEELQKANREKKALASVAKAVKWGRAFGGAAIIVDNGEEYDQPLPETIAPGSLRRFMVRSRRYIRPEYPYDIENGAEYYLVTPIQGGQVLRVHRSRMYLFLGEDCTSNVRLQRQGFGLSVIELVYPALKSNAGQYDASDRIVQDLSQAVFKLHGVVEALSDDEGEQADGFLTRVRNMDRARGMANAVVLDADMNESFEQVGRANVAGLEGILDKSDQRLAMNGEMPVTRLMGVSPGGMNATGESDTRGWYDTVRAYRTEVVAPAVEWALRIVAQDRGLAISADEDLVTWPSLWQRTPEEEDERRSKTLTMYGTASQQGLLTTDEAIRAVLETGLFPEIELDMAARAAKADLANQLRERLAMTGPPQPDPNAPPTPGTNQPPGAPDDEDPPEDA